MYYSTYILLNRLSSPVPSLEWVCYIRHHLLKTLGVRRCAAFFGHLHLLVQLSLTSVYIEIDLLKAFGTDFANCSPRERK